MQWAGHIARMNEERLSKKVFQADMTGRRPLGRPRKDWHRCVLEDMKEWGIEPDEWQERAQDRREWKNLSRAVMGQQVAQRPME